MIMTRVFEDDDIVDIDVQIKKFVAKNKIKDYHHYADVPYATKKYAEMIIWKV